MAEKLERFERLVEGIEGEDRAKGVGDGLVRTKSVDALKAEPIAEDRCEDMMLFDHAKVADPIGVSISRKARIVRDAQIAQANGGVWKLGGKRRLGKIFGIDKRAFSLHTIKPKRKAAVWKLLFFREDEDGGAAAPKGDKAFFAPERIRSILHPLGFGLDRAGVRAAAFSDPKRREGKSSEANPG